MRNYDFSLVKRFVYIVNGKTILLKYSSNYLHKPVVTDIKAFV